MAKAPAKPAAAPAGEEKPQGSKKLLIIVIALLVVLIAAGAAFFLLGNKQHAESPKEHAPELQPKFVTLEPFTVNLQREEGDQFLQIGITLKFLQPELEEKLKLSNAEIRSKMLLLLSSKRASELSTSEGKKSLQEEIMNETNSVLSGGSEHGDDKHSKNEGITDVLFTSFIIQ
ncbi:MAG: flagellar basal body-associated protein FliL [Nitrosomonadales bacterium]|nr:flagellar basal body-associated protein FliL [Nitrosomonadales bacterium]